jgi:hypothetical protein
MKHLRMRVLDLLISVIDSWIVIYHMPSSLSIPKRVALGSKNYQSHLYYTLIVQGDLLFTVRSETCKHTQQRHLIMRTITNHADC